MGERQAGKNGRKKREREGRWKGGDCITGHHIHVADIPQHLPPGRGPTHPLDNIISTSTYVHVHATSITHARKGTFLSYSV